MVVDLPSGFFHYCSCACIRHLLKLHIAPSGYYSATINFQTTQYPVLCHFYCRIREQNISFSMNINKNRFLGYFNIGGHSKSTFARNFQFLTPSPLFAPLGSYPPFKKSSATLMNSQIKNRGVKREKRINFFVNST